jgi:hypothetical protein
MPERDAKGSREASTAMPPPALRVITTLSDSSRPAAAGPAGAGSLPEAAVGQPIARLSAATVGNTDHAERLPGGFQSDREIPIPRIFRMICKGQ